MMCGSRISRRCGFCIALRNERPGIVPTMVSHLRACAVDLVKRASNGSATSCDQGKRRHPTQDRQERSHHQRAEAHPLQGASAALSPSSLVSFADGHHPRSSHPLRPIQGVSALKVSDEFTVPLCAIHHSENHTTGNERRWWQKHNIDPLSVARRLWEESCSAWRPHAK